MIHKCDFSVACMQLRGIIYRSSDTVYSNLGTKRWTAILYHHLYFYNLQDVWGFNIPMPVLLYVAYLVRGRYVLLALYWVRPLTSTQNWVHERVPKAMQCTYGPCTNPHGARSKTFDKAVYYHPRLHPASQVPRVLGIGVHAWPVKGVGCSSYWPVWSNGSSTWGTSTQHSCEVSCPAADCWFTHDYKYYSKEATFMVPSSTGCMQSCTVLKELSILGKVFGLLDNRSHCNDTLTREYDACL
jgi:hypothetical protein